MLIIFCNKTYLRVKNAGLTSQSQQYSHVNTCSPTPTVSSPIRLDLDYIRELFQYTTYDFAPGAITTQSSIVVS